MRNVLLTIASVAVIVAGSVSTTTSAPRPERPHLRAAESQGRAAGLDRFVCGTYGGNETQHYYLAQKNARLEKQVEAGVVQRSEAAIEFVQGDVWVVEDDGTLLFSGLNAFDTDFSTFHFEPNGDGTYTVSSITFNFDATLGTLVSPGDDGEFIANPVFSFPFAGSGWTQFYIGGNGLISFGDLPNPSGFYDNDDFFNTTPKICPYFMDLNPTAAGGVYAKSELTKYTVTWNGVPDYGTANLNTVQLVLYDDGSFDITMNGIASTLQANSAPIFLGFSLGSPSDLEVISYSDDLPFTGSTGKAFYEDYLNITNPLVNELALFQRFYLNFPDEFFQLIFFTNFTQTMGGFANERNIKNDVQGIGLGIFDNSTSYGSAGVLESRCNMNRLGVWPSLPDSRFFSDGNNFLTIMGQEAGHRWGAFMNFVDANLQVSNLILGRADAHWSYYVDNDHSSLEGGNWEETSPGNYICPTQIDYFPSVDEYTFGLRLPEEVKDLYYLDSPSNNLPSNRDNGTPPLGAIATGVPVTVTIDDIIAAEGPRVPAEGGENKDLRQGWILLSQNGNAPSQAEIEKIVAFRRAWEDYFEVSCSGRLTCNTSLSSNYAVGVIGGSVLNKLTDQPIDAEFTATATERGFVQEVPGGSRYFFRFQADSSSGLSEAVTVIFEAPGYYPDTLMTSVDYGDEVTMDVQLMPVPSTVRPGTSVPNALYPNYPNPFNPVTTIRYDLASEGPATLAVFDVRGARVRTLAARVHTAGIHEVVWDGRDDDGRDAASGIYFYRLETADYVRTRKMVLVK